MNYMQRILTAIALSLLGVSIPPDDLTKDPILPAPSDEWLFCWHEWRTVNDWWAPNQSEETFHEIVLFSRTARTAEEAAREVAGATNWELYPTSTPEIVTPADVRRRWVEALQRRRAIEPESPTVEDLLWLYDLHAKRPPKK